MNKRKLVLSIAVVILVLLASYLYANRELISLKSGRALPIQWSSPYLDQKDEKPIQLTESNQNISNPDVHITPLYYLPQSKEIHFGLWYKRGAYSSENIPDRVFQTTFKDEDGNIYDREMVTIVRSGWFELFHYRSVSVDLTDQKSIEMTLSLIKEEGDNITPVETAQLTIPLDKIE